MERVRPRPADPGRDALVDDLRLFRRGVGHPDVARMVGLFDLTEALGEGLADRAFRALERLQQRHGADPETPIGAFFYLAGWGVGGHSIEQRRRWYRDTYLTDISTAWRRAERGMSQLADLIRDQTEHSRPWAVVSVFQTGDSWQGFLDFNLGLESWRPPVVQLNGEELNGIDYVFHDADDRDPARQGPGTRYASRVILPETELGARGQTTEALGRLRVIWAMPVWPVWQVLGWTVNPGIYVRTRIFRERAVEASLWETTPPTVS